MREAYGRADILVNSAGFTRVVPHADLEALTDEIFDAILIANVRGTFSVIRSLAPLLRESGEGRDRECLIDRRVYGSWAAASPTVPQRPRWTR